jgi:alpha-glucosidase
MNETDAPTYDWTNARQRRKSWKAEERPKNLFSGESQIQTCQVAGVEVLKISAHPDGLDKLTESFMVHHNHEWQNRASDGLDSSLPFNLQWQQSKDGRFDFFFALPEGIRCFGLGERFSTLDLRGAKHTLCTTDETKHTEFADSLYKAIPFMVLFDGDQSYGFFLDSPAPQRWDLDSELSCEGKIELFTRQGWSLSVFGPAPLPGILNSFTAVTGKAKMPPLWSLGHQQCRWSYPDEETVREIATEFRKRKIPCDTIYLDIDYMDEYRVFTHSSERFPTFTKMIEDLRAQNFNVITIVDPGVKQDEKFPVFKSGLKDDLFCKTQEGEVYIGQVWPGHSAFPDFLKAETRKWWADNHSFYIKNGIAGIWNDMNEPALFNWTRPLPEVMDALPIESAQQFCQTLDGERIGHLEVRNLFGTLMCKSTHQGLIEQRPNERPFILTRSATAGIQNYSAVWLGDNYSWYEHLAKSIPMLLNMGMSGVAFCGVDVGGFFGNCPPEMLVRWYELGIFYPLFRNHCWLEGRAQEPFAYGEKCEALVRKLIETRYALLPYIYSLFHEHTVSGAPLMRPLSWHYPLDKIAANIDDEFLLGENILVAPITERAKSCRNIYFPEGLWHPFSGGAPVKGGQTLTVEIPLGAVPAFVRDGSIIPMASAMQSTVEYENCTITFKCFGGNAQGLYFEDDGKSFDYERGDYNEWQLTLKDGQLSATSRHKSFDSHDRKYALDIQGKSVAFKLS